MEGPLLVLRVLLALVCVIGIIWYAGRRLGGQTQARRASHEPSVRLVGRQTIGRHNGVAVVAVGTRRMLVGYGDTQVTMLAELDPVEEEAPVAAPAAVLPRPRRTPVPTASPSTTPVSSTAVDSPLDAPMPDVELREPALVGAVVPRTAGPTSALHGSLLAPTTWRQTWQALQERTVRR
ncbi:flagellar biosynthetic protein FliO [Cellulomonas soli]|uniref:flagellar biosynthetic protein FliO n=1 Tax=Cellulomonas soli TaxID=931535 RepID=UPI003F83FB27